MQGEGRFVKARIIEIFSSVQGEGLWVGRPQVFVRFHGCKLKCGYCDTPLTHHQIDSARIEFPPFSKKFENYPLEFDPDELNRQVRRFEIPSLAITGGEPLEQVNFLQKWLPTLEGKYDILLETSGVETEALKRVMGLVSIVSLDIKIPSATGETPFWEEHKKFINVALNKSCYAKVVFDEKITNEEIEHLMMLLHQYSSLPVVFQPVSPIQKRDIKRCLEIFWLFSQKFPDRVRFIPQTHKFLSIL